MIFIFYFFATISVFLGYKSLRGGVNYLNYFKKELVKPSSDFTPFCSVIAPCRGLDVGLRGNLSALSSQDYPNYEILFVVDDERDEATRIIEEVSRESAKSAKLIVAGKATESGQKVHNLRQAILHVSNESAVLVFVDSDARVTEDWLKNLVAPLRDETVGATTGYRWFVSNGGGFFSQMLSVWNASIASALGANAAGNFCWGGSTAIRREAFEKLHIREKWHGALSDDFTITRVMKAANLKIHFAPQCLTASFEDCGFRHLLEFTTRQMKITRVYAPHLWRASFLGAGVFTFAFWSGFLILFFVSGFHFWLTLAFLLTIFAFGAAKARLRLSAARLVLKNYEEHLTRQTIFQMTLWTLAPILYFYNCFLALLSRQIVWRGVEYKLQSPTETVILRRGERKTLK